MILGKPAPFVRAFVEAVNDTMREPHPRHAMSATQRTGVAFCVTAVLITNSICWARFERASRGTSSLAALSWMFRPSKSPWHHNGHPGYRRYRQPALQIGEGLGLSL